MTPLECFKADAFRQYRRAAFRDIVFGALTSRTFRVMLTLRICQQLGTTGGIATLLLPLAQILHRLSTTQAGMDFPWRTPVDAGLAICHGWGIVINERTRIGKNVTIFHGVTLGQKDRILPGGDRIETFPVLEDEVWVGPNAIVVGDVTIGKGSRIAPGAYVTESVPPHCIVVGNPAIVRRRDCASDVKNPAPV